MASALKQRRRATFKLEAFIPSNSGFPFGFLRVVNMISSFDNAFFIWSLTSGIAFNMIFPLLKNGKVRLQLSAPRLLRMQIISLTKRD